MADTSNMAGNSGWSSVAGAAVQGATGLLGSVIAGEYNKKLAERQNEFNLQMWHLQNEYNSPQAQMQRFRDAGLNPNLIYGQGSNGNATSAPQQVVPEPPDIQGTANRLGALFNIENLRTVRANRIKAQADADNATTDAKRNRLQLFAENTFGSSYYFDPVTGQFVQRPEDKPGERTIYHPSAYYFHDILARQYARTHLIPYRAALLDFQRQFLAPQVSMANYEARFIPESFWIGQGTKVLNSIGGLIPKFGLRLGGGRGYTAPNGRYYNY